MKRDCLKNTFWTISICQLMHIHSIKEYSKTQIAIWETNQIWMCSIMFWGSAWLCKVCSYLALLSTTVLKLLLMILSPPPRNLTWESTARNTLYSLYRWCWIHFWSLHSGKLIGLTISYNFHINLHHPRWGFDLILNIFHLYIVPRWLLTWLPVLSLNRYEFIGGSLRNHIYV